MATTTPVATISDLVQTAKTLANHIASVRANDLGHTVQVDPVTLFTGTSTAEAVRDLIDSLDRTADYDIQITVDWMHVTKNENHTNPSVTFKAG